MAGTSFLLLVLVPVLLFAVLSRVDRSVADPDPPDDAPDPDEADLIVANLAAAKRLRREAAAAEDPREKASLARFADEAESDAEKLKNDLE